MRAEGTVMCCALIALAAETAVFLEEIAVSQTPKRLQGLMRVRWQSHGGKAESWWTVLPAGANTSGVAGGPAVHGPLNPTGCSCTLPHPSCVKPSEVLEAQGDKSLQAQGCTPCWWYTPC